MLFDSQSIYFEISSFYSLSTYTYIDLKCTDTLLPTSCSFSTTTTTTTAPKTLKEYTTNYRFYYNYNNFNLLKSYNNKKN